MKTKAYLFLTQPHITTISHFWYILIKTHSKMLLHIASHHQKRKFSICLEIIVLLTTTHQSLDKIGPSWRNNLCIYFLHHYKQKPIHETLDLDKVRARSCPHMRLLAHIWALFRALPTLPHPHFSPITKFEENHLQTNLSYGVWSVRRSLSFSLSPSFPASKLSIKFSEFNLDWKYIWSY